MNGRAALLGAFVMTSCGQSIPQTRLYRLSVPPVELARAPADCEPGPKLVIDELRVDASYDERRIVYRESEFELEHYNYHEWSAPPGELVADALREGYESTGVFAEVERDWDPGASGFLQGRVVALEEVDRTRREWVGRLVLDLQLLVGDPDGEERPVWSQRFEIVRALPERSPEGLAAATSAAIAEIVAESTPAIVAALAVC